MCNVKRFANSKRNKKQNEHFEGNAKSKERDISVCVCVFSLKKETLVVFFLLFF